MIIDVGSTVRIIRQAKGLKLKDVAEASGVSTPFVTLIEQGEREPSLTVLRRIAIALDIPVEALILLSQPTEGKIETRDRKAKGLMRSIQHLVSAEQNLKKYLEEEGENGHEAVRSAS